MSAANETANNIFSTADARERAEQTLSGLALDLREQDHSLVIELEAADVVKAATLLRDDEQLSCKYLSHVAGVDNVDHLEAVYVLRSMDHPVLIELRVEIADRTNPVVPTVSNIWSGANWHEREAFDLFGIRFADHPDLRRILNREDLDVYPYRKDARPQRKTRPEWRWEGLEPPRRLPGEPPRRDRS